MALVVDVKGKRYFPDWLFIPMYPFELPKDLTGKPPFTLPDYLVDDKLRMKLIAQAGIMACAIYIGMKK